ncbi:MAG: Lrp/AsnC family transcriptional regulator [Anaerolineales bacterium]|nr:Lrp/AsnC family transcriptional regulator [Anaerolineales bacterium]MCX7756688.1 Lrp/AsnC family transcriptional regulator [Anaerolineales bacterium]MDW8279267.1 Lrp/AsnC family transcriptional regulator [Anaerolineales bacterium]
MENANNLPVRQDGLDSVDQYIIEAMRQDGRMAFAQIAQQLNVSPGMIRVRYNRLVETGILKVVAVTNPLRMGYKTMAMIGIRTEGEKMLQVAEQVATFEEVIYLIVVSGRYDIIAEVVCRDHADLLRFLTEKLYKVDGVRESESFMHLKIQKEVYF